MADLRSQERRERTTETHTYTAKRKPSHKTTIVLLGLTGAGKSTFASLASGRDDLEIGHGIKSCTQEPQAVEFVLDRRDVVLIDTPGLDEEKRSDLRVLEDIAQWMARKGYAKDGQRPDGLIFLHPITHNRVGASEWNRTRLLEGILGPNFCRRVVIATTMWDELVTTRYDALEKSLQARVGKGGVWHNIFRQGAKMEKYDNTVDSAHNIIRHIVSILDKDGRVDSLLHTEMQENQGRIAHTLVGKELEKQIQDKVVIVEQELCHHLAERPPDAFRTSKDPSQRRDWKRWQKEYQNMEEELILKQQELKKRRNIVVSYYSGTFLVRGLQSLRLAAIDKTVQATASSIPLKALTLSRAQPTPLQEPGDEGDGAG